MSKDRAAKRAARLAELQTMTNKEVAAETEASRQRTLANRVLHHRENEKVLDLKDRTGPCTAESVRCPEARIMLIDTPECCVRHIRFILKTVAADLDRAGIRWWIDYGTVLGFVRNGGLIPYDKDADLGILADDRPKLLKLKDAWNAAGFHATYAPPRATERFRTGDRVKVALSRTNRTNTDIFIWERDQPKPGWLDRKNYIGADLFKGREMPETMIFPLRRGQWDGIDVSVPARPEQLCEHRYGEDWSIPQRAKHPPEPRQ